MRGKSLYHAADSSFNPCKDMLYNDILQEVTFCTDSNLFLAFVGNQRIPHVLKNDKTVQESDRLNFCH